MARAALERVLAAPDFVASPRLAAFLRFVVEATLDGRAEAIKGYTIAVEALGRPVSFDPQTDPIVRVEATRLRRALERHYAGPGADDPLCIAIPKGGYVPLFTPRPAAGGEAAPPPEGADGTEDAATEPEAVGERGTPARQPGARRAILAGLAVLALVAVTGIALFALGRLPGGAPADPVRDAADRAGLPLVDVRPFEVVGAGAPAASGLRALETRLRDSFARFDFVDVMDAGESGGAVRECRGTPPRSVFAVSALAEGRADGTFTLLVRLTDKCEGTIAWSGSYEALKDGRDMAASEARVVHDVAVALMESHAVIPTRARAQARANAPGSAFGCIARGLSVLRGEDAGAAASAHGCLDQLEVRDSGFALAHAMRARLLLDEAETAREGGPDAALLARMTHEAELAADLAPTSAFAARTLALVDLFQGERNAALSAAEQALRLNDLDYETAAVVGGVLIGLGDLDRGARLIAAARANGITRTTRQDTSLALAAFLSGDREAARAVLPALALHPTAQTRLALALAWHALGRAAEARAAVAALVHETPGGADTVRDMVRHLLPVPDLAQRAVDALESAGLSSGAARM